MMSAISRATHIAIDVTAAQFHAAAAAAAAAAINSSCRQLASISLRELNAQHSSHVRCTHHRMVLHY